MPGLKEILKDKTGFPDNLAINLGNGTAVNLGQVRELSLADQATLVKKEEELNSRSTTLDTEGQRLKKAQENTANLFILLNTAQEALKSGRLDDPAVKQLFGNTPPPGVSGGNNDPFAALSRLEQDALIGPVVQVIKLVREEAKAAQASVARTVETQKMMATNYLNGMLEDRYDRLVPADKQDKLPIAKLIEHAVKSNYFSTDSTPDIRRAYKDLTAADSAAARETEIRADERKKYEKELAEKTGGTGSRGDIFVPTPTIHGLDVHNRSGQAATPFKSLDEAFAAAAKDPSIWE